MMFVQIACVFGAIFLSCAAHCEEKSSIYSSTSYSSIDPLALGLYSTNKLSADYTVDFGRAAITAAAVSANHVNPDRGIGSRLSLKLTDRTAAVSTLERYETGLNQSRVIISTSSELDGLTLITGIGVSLDNPTAIVSSEATKPMYSLDSQHYAWYFKTQVEAGGDEWRCEYGLRACYEVETRSLLTLEAGPIMGSGSKQNVEMVIFAACSVKL